MPFGGNSWSTRPNNASDCSAARRMVAVEAITLAVVPAALMTPCTPISYRAAVVPRGPFNRWSSSCSTREWTNATGPS